MERARNDLDNHILILKWSIEKDVEEIEYEIKSLSGLNTQMLALQWALGENERTQED